MGAAGNNERGGLLPCVPHEKTVNRFYGDHYKISSL